MYGKDASIRLSPGISTPSNRGINCLFAPFANSADQPPCRCLWRGFLQTTRTTFLRLITLQLSQSRFTDGLTFIASDSARQEPTGGQKNAARRETPPGAFLVQQPYFCRKVIRPFVRS